MEPSGDAAPAPEARAPNDSMARSHWLTTLWATSSHDRAKTCSRIRSASHSRINAASIQLASARSSSGSSNRVPANVGTMRSMSPTFVATIGRPQAIASKITLGQPSKSLARTNALAAPRSQSIKSGAIILFGALAPDDGETGIRAGFEDAWQTPDNAMKALARRDVADGNKKTSLLR